MSGGGTAATGDRVCGAGLRPYRRTSQGGNSADQPGGPTSGRSMRFAAVALSFVMSEAAGLVLLADIALGATLAGARQPRA